MICYICRALSRIFRNILGSCWSAINSITMMVAKDLHLRMKLFIDDNALIVILQNVTVVISGQL